MKSILLCMILWLLQKKSPTHISKLPSVSNIQELSERSLNEVKSPENQASTVPAAHTSDQNNTDVLPRTYGNNPGFVNEDDMEAAPILFVDDSEGSSKVSQDSDKDCVTPEQSSSEILTNSSEELLHKSPVCPEQEQDASKLKQTIDENLKENLCENKNSFSENHPFEFSNLATVDAINLSQIIELNRTVLFCEDMELTIRPVHQIIVENAPNFDNPVITEESKEITTEKCPPAEIPDYLQIEKWNLEINEEDELQNMAPIAFCEPEDEKNYDSYYEKRRRRIDLEYGLKTYTDETGKSFGKTKDKTVSSDKDTAASGRDNLNNCNKDNAKTDSFSEDANTKKPDNPVCFNISDDDTEFYNLQLPCNSNFTSAPTTDVLMPKSTASNCSSKNSNKISTRSKKAVPPLNPTKTNEKPASKSLLPVEELLEEKLKTKASLVGADNFSDDDTEFYNLQLPCNNNFTSAPTTDVLMLKSTASNSCSKNSNKISTRSKKADPTKTNEKPALKKIKDSKNCQPQLSSMKTLEGCSFMYESPISTGKELKGKSLFKVNWDDCKENIVSPQMQEEDKGCTNVNSELTALCGNSVKLSVAMRPENSPVLRNTVNLPENQSSLPRRRQLQHVNYREPSLKRTLRRL